MHFLSSPTLHSTDKCLAALHAARYSIHNIDRQLYNSGQVSLTDRHPLDQIGPT